MKNFIWSLLGREKSHSRYSQVFFSGNPFKMSKIAPVSIVSNVSVVSTVSVEKC